MNLRPPVRETFQTHHAGLIEPGTANSSNGHSSRRQRNGAVTTVRPHPDAWAAAVQACGGDLGRLVIHPNGAVTVSNQSVGKTPRLQQDTTPARLYSAQAALLAIRDATNLATAQPDLAKVSPHELLDAMLCRLHHVRRTASEALSADTGERDR